MERKISIRRATSAGYRLPERPSVALASQSSVSVRKPPQSAQRNTSQPPPERDPDTQDQVKQDRVWRELVRAERDRVKEWEKNWSFLKDFDQLGNPKTEAPLPSYVSLYSNTVPNTSNQMFGSRVCTGLVAFREQKSVGVWGGITWSDWDVVAERLPVKRFRGLV